MQIAVQDVLKLSGKGIALRVRGGLVTICKGGTQSSKGIGMCKRYRSAKEKVCNYLVADQRGATALEYGLIAGLIAAVLFGTLQATGTTLRNIFVVIEEAVRLASTGG
jgi:pilus assembly protein Flp/PilA